MIAAHRMGFKRLETDAEVLARATAKAGHEVKVGCCPPPPAPPPLFFGYWGLAAPEPTPAPAPPDTADATADRHGIQRRIVEEIPS